MGETTIHWRKSREHWAQAPEFGVGNANANCPPYLVMFEKFTHHIACITIRGERTDKKYRTEFTKTRNFKGNFFSVGEA